MMIPENAVKGEWHVLRFEYLSIWQKMQVILEDTLSAIHIIQFNEHIYFFLVQIVKSVSSTAIVKIQVTNLLWKFHMNSETTGQSTHDHAG